jgi:hypothetical protein
MQLAKAAEEAPPTPLATPAEMQEQMQPQPLPEEPIQTAPEVDQKIPPPVKLEGNVGPKDAGVPKPPAGGWFEDMPPPDGPLEDDDQVKQAKEEAAKDGKD